MTEKVQKQLEQQNYIIEKLQADMKNMNIKHTNLQNIVTTNHEQLTGAISRAETSSTQIRTELCAMISSCHNQQSEKIASLEKIMNKSEGKLDQVMNLLLDRYGTETSTKTTAMNRKTEKSLNGSEMSIENNSQNKNHRNEQDTRTTKKVLTEQKNIDNRDLMESISWYLGDSQSICKEKGEAGPNFH